jgi:hypothetical protein
MPTSKESATEEHLLISPSTAGPLWARLQKERLLCPTGIQVEVLIVENLGRVLYQFIFLKVDQLLARQALASFRL